MYERYQLHDFEKWRRSKLTAYVQSLNPSEKKAFDERNALLIKQSKKESSKRNLKAKDQSLHEIGIVPAIHDGKNTLEMSEHQPSQDMYKRAMMETNQAANMESKAHEMAQAKASAAVKEAESRHFEDTFTELNHRLMTYENGTSAEPDAALELF